ncbi:manganese/iron transporter ATP-binding protein [Haematobacter massiliensis]|uniref:Manganese/iron transporter ATP-binding protein n=1 Tax=Haematobacter massiliensis TaxID=195105 RepID=A0A086Y560_9RHOB|nr:manganese/iron transporter ATP-binding protein [Haematobacter massiliensis]OWJ71218.1 manganese/iron transporter ATP-binding protein [Haematobacter massiliensis]OWJ84243.1 manganese/iron transporter ATP-binding protein [Haematobacter massiliensis]QBJ26029.1 ATP-binding cassette domain-containing protein [Haematobacter massiliensis]
MTEDAGVLVHGLTVTYRNGHTALYDAGFSVPSGSITALIGPNGAGKSTLFKALMGLLPNSGEVRLLGLPVAEALGRSLVAYVPQAEEVDWTFPVLVEDVVMMGRYGRMGFLRRPRAADREAVDTALARVGMSEYRHRQIGELSGGQRKRVFLARALAQDGRLILLDEPFTGVDAGTEDRIITLLGELREEGRVMLVSTHDLARVPEFCDRVVIVRGTVLASGPTAEIFTPETLALAFGEPRQEKARALPWGAGALSEQSVDAAWHPPADISEADAAGPRTAGSAAHEAHQSPAFGLQKTGQTNNASRAERDGSEEPPSAWQPAPQQIPSSRTVPSPAQHATRERPSGQPPAGTALTGSGTGS